MTYSSSFQLITMPLWVVQVPRSRLRALWVPQCIGFWAQLLTIRSALLPAVCSAFAILGNSSVLTIDSHLVTIWEVSLASSYKSVRGVLNDAGYPPSMNLPSSSYQTAL